MQNERIDQLLREEVLLTLQRALVGAVPASLRAVTCDWAEAKITLRYIFDGPVGGDDVVDIMAVGEDVMSHFRDTMALDEQIIQVDRPADLAPHFLRAWAFMRKEEPLVPTDKALSADKGMAR